VESRRNGKMLRCPRCGAKLRPVDFGVWRCSACREIYSKRYIDKYFNER